MRLHGGGTSSEVVSLAWPESVSEAMLLCPRTCREGSEVPGVCSSGFEASGLDSLPFGPGRVSTASWVLAKGNAFSTTGGLTASNTTLAILGMKSRSVKGGGIRSRCLVGILLVNRVQTGR